MTEEKTTRKPTTVTYAKRLRKAVDDFNAAKDALIEEDVTVRYEINSEGDLQVDEIKIVKTL
jgi:hypothetical protein